MKISYNFYLLINLYGTYFWLAQQQVDERVQRHPQWYRPDTKLFEKITEEEKEIEEAFKLYQKSPTEVHLRELKTEIGDELFALICFANSKGISLDECFDLMMQKNKNRENNNYEKEKK